MNTYDQKHLELLTLIHSGQWRDIAEADTRDVQVLVACKYVVIKTGADEPPQILVTPEGQRYLNTLGGFRGLEFQVPTSVSPARTLRL